MIFVWISLWTIALILWLTDWSRLSTRYAGATAFAGGAGGLAVTLSERFPDPPQIIYFLDVGCSLVSQLGVPYFFLLFCLAFQNFIADQQLVRILSWLAIVPPLVMLAITPINPVYIYDFGLSLFWVGPYILAGCLLLIISSYREKNPLLKRVRYFTNLVTIMPVLFNFIVSNVLRSFEIDSFWKWNAVIIPITFVLFIVFGLSFGVLGVKLRVERYRLDSTIRALTSGAAILNHSIKNELAKMDALLNRVRTQTSVETDAGVQRDLGHVFDSIQHLNEMVERIHAHMQDFTLKTENHNMYELVERAKQKVIAANDGKRLIDIRNELNPQLELQFDQVHVAELLHNLLVNAMESMDGAGANGTGTIRITASESKKEAVIAVEDSGCGIPADRLNSVLEPFYSTKKSKTNFGLGLSYCFQVMQKHGGMLNLYSEPGKGTTVFLHFPKQRRKTFR